ncbi:hypothetical protein [Methylibium petroleiphilum]|uniref:hypothetical protein n=1 Tax=Methylibium petroleiphilum TaxID=105560 RepID=UPI00003CD1D7|nr:hypothetical protein [Methylibium petroleiphilum]
MNTKRNQGSPEGRAAYAQLVQVKTAARARMRLIFRISMAVVAALGAGAAFLTNGSFLFVMPALICGFLLFASLLFAGNDAPRLKREEYVALPGAQGPDGEHACIACGHRGIYRRTVYKTTTTLADCSKCEQPLWASNVGA